MSSVKATAEELKGHAERAAGKVLDDDTLRREGEAQAEKGREQRRADVHEAKADAAEAREKANQELK